MNAMELQGVYTPFPTPFCPDGRVYRQGLRDLLRFLTPHVDGLFVLGSYGSGPLMSRDERKNVLELILEEVNGRIPVVPYTTRPDTQSSIDLSRHAKQAGAAGIFVKNPGTDLTMSIEEQFGYFSDILDAVADEDFAVLVSNRAGEAKENIVPPALAKRLAHRGLRLLQDSSFDIAVFFQYQDALADFPDFNVVMGTDELFIPAFEAGARVCACTYGAIFPELAKKMCDDWHAGRRQEAWETQKTLRKIGEIFHSVLSLPAMHALLRMRGIDPGVPRKPFREIPEAELIFIEAELVRLGVLERRRKLT